MTKIARKKKDFNLPEEGGVPFWQPFVHTISTLFAQYKKTEDEYRFICQETGCIYEYREEEGWVRFEPKDWDTCFVDDEDKFATYFQGQWNAYRFSIGGIREEVRNFAKVMSSKMDLREDKYGDSWRHLRLCNLVYRLLQELEELDHSYHHESVESTAEEAIDIANIAMMIYTNIKENGDN